MAFTPQGAHPSPWNVMEWDSGMGALSTYNNVFMASSIPSPGMLLLSIEIDLTAPVGAFPWVDDMADPWTAEIGFYIANPPNYPSSYQDACVDNPKPHFGFILQADGYAHGVSIGKQTMAWMGGADWIQTIDVMSGHLDGIGSGTIGSSYYTLQMANYGVYENAYINMKDKDGIYKYQAHTIRADAEFFSLFPNAHNFVLWACAPPGGGTSIWLDHIYVGTGCFPAWRPPIAQVPQNIGAKLNADREPITDWNTCVRDGSASYDFYGARLKYDWEMINAPDSSAVAAIYRDCYTDPSASPYTDTLKGVTLSGAVGDWVIYNNACYIITGVPAPNQITIDSTVFPTGTTGIYVKVISQNPMIWGTSDRPITAVPVDATGSYIIRLRVHNGVYYSHPAETAIMVRDPHTKTGVEVNTEWIWGYLSDVWGMVEEKGFASEYFNSLLQQSSSLLLQAWQAEYDSNLATAQPFLDYRWMVLDRMVEEEGTATFASGLACVAGVWVGAIVSQTLALRLYTGSEGYEDVTLTLTAANVTEELSGLNTALEGYGIIASTMEHAGSSWIFIKGPIGIEVTGGALAGVQFTAGDTNMLESAGVMAAGDVVGPYRYRLDRCAYGLTLDRHFLVLRGEAYEIVNIAHGPTIPYSELTLARQLPDMDDSELTVWAIPAHYKSATGYYEQLCFSGDELTLMRVDISDVVTTEEVTLVGCTSYGVGTMSFTPTNPYYATVAPLAVRRTFYHPIDDRVFSIPLVQSKIAPEAPTDYFYEGSAYAITTYRDSKCLNYQYYSSPTYVNSAYEQVPIHADLTARAVAEQVIVDNSEIIYRNFGYMVGLEYDPSVTPDVLHYLDAVRGLWKIYGEGRTVENLRRGINMFFSLSVCQRDGVIHEVLFYKNSDYGHMLVVDADSAATTRTYVLDRKAGLALNPRTGMAWQAGDSIYRFERISGGADVRDIVSDPNYYSSYVGPSFGVLPEELNRLTAYHRFLVRASGYSVTGNRYSEFLEFVNEWRPRYTQLIFALLATPFSEIEFLDSVHMTVKLSLLDHFCSYWTCALDDCDLGGTFSKLDEAIWWTSPPPPDAVPSMISTKLDFGKYCPKNIITALLSYTFAGPMQWDTIWFFDHYGDPLGPGVDWQWDVAYTDIYTATIPLET